MTLNLYVEAAEAAYLCTNFEQMERLAQVVLKQARTLLDRVKVYEVKIEAETARGQLLEAVQTALSVVNLLGVKLPSPSKLNIVLELLSTKLALGLKRIEDLIDLPKMTDAYLLAAMRILSSVSDAIYTAVPELLALIILKQVQLSLKYGNANESAIAYASYGSLL